MLRCEGKRASVYIPQRPATIGLTAALPTKYGVHPYGQGLQPSAPSTAHLERGVMVVLVPGRGQVSYEIESATEMKTQ